MGLLPLTGLQTGGEWWANGAWMGHKSAAGDMQKNRWMHFTSGK